jgi:hypothetical protein
MTGSGKDLRHRWGTQSWRDPNLRIRIIRTAQLIDDGKMRGDNG